VAAYFIHLAAQGHCTARPACPPSLCRPSLLLHNAYALNLSFACMQGCPVLRFLVLRLNVTTLGQAAHALAPMQHLEYLDICAPPAGEQELHMLQGLTSLKLGG
jgi:hypothetical protein